MATCFSTSSKWNAAGIHGLWRQMAQKLRQDRGHSGQIPESPRVEDGRDKHSITSPVISFEEHHREHLETTPLESTSITSTYVWRLLYRSCQPGSGHRFHQHFCVFSQSYTVIFIYSQTCPSIDRLWDRNNLQKFAQDIFRRPCQLPLQLCARYALAGSRK